MTNQTESNHGDVTLRLIIWSAQFVFEFVPDLIQFHLNCKFRNIASKLNEWSWWRAFSHFKSLGHTGSLRNHAFHWIYIKQLSYWCLTRGMQYMRNGWDQPAECGDITGQMRWRTTDSLPSYKFAFRPRWANKSIKTEDGCPWSATTIVHSLPMTPSKKEKNLPVVGRNKL